MTVRADDNWFQRRYFAWAAPHYAKMPPRTRAEVERIDRFLYSRRGVPLWLGLAIAIALVAALLAAASLPWQLAIAVSFMVCVALPFGILGAWLQPEKFAGRKLVRLALLTTAGIYLGAAVGFVSGRIQKHGGLALDSLGAGARAALVEVMPLLAAATVGLVFVLGVTAFARRQLLTIELERARLVQERDAAARQAAESRLQLLRAQIRPHFIFNTLASLQHWVDTGDARAGPLMRSLTALLRRSTEAMDAADAAIAEEAETVTHYLQIVASRIGPRLRFRVAVEPACADVPVPAGLLLTLVENAIEHGIEPQHAGGTVDVAAERKGDTIEIRVTDDGAGIAPGATIASPLAPAPGGRGIGIANSRERLRHRFGDAATLDLLPGEGGRGCVARVRIAPAAAGVSS